VLDIPADKFMAADDSAAQFPRLQVDGAFAPHTQASRRELIWKREGYTLPLSQISHQFRSFEEEILCSRSHSRLQRRQAHSVPKTPHRCLGYNLEKITLTPRISGSAIVSHLTPKPREICSLCGEVVGFAEVFRCICGTDGGLLISLFFVKKLPIIDVDYFY
jgi:hypothetical protein